MPSPSARPAVVFDLDGTLADTIDIIQDEIVAAIRRFGHDVQPAAVRRLIGRPLGVTLTTLTGIEDEKTLAEISADYYPHYAAATERRAGDLLFPGVVGLLQRLRSEGYAIGVITAKITSEAEHLLEHVDIRHLVDVLVATDRVEHGKPAPDSALLALRELDAEAASSWYVGDAVGGMQMARAAGMPALGITTGVGSRTELEPFADAVVDSVDEIHGVVTRAVAREGAAN